MLSIKQYRNKLIVICIITILVSVAIYNFDFSNNELNETLFDGLSSGFFLKSLVLTSLILLLFSERVYKIWRWFALLAVPLALVTIIFPIHETGRSIVGGKKELSDFYGYVFIVVTLLIALGVTIRDRLKK